MFRTKLVNWGVEMPRAKRQRVERTDSWDQLCLLSKWPEQVVYELIRSGASYQSGFFVR